jgi:hypothetical protein
LARHPLAIFNFDKPHVAGLWPTIIIIRMTPVTGTPDQEKIVAQFFAELVKMTAKAAGSAFKYPIQALVDAYKKDFTKYLEQTLNRCSYVKTILNYDQPVPLSSIYVATKLLSNKKYYDDYKFLEQIFNIRNAVVVGTAGSGKSMFMRYVFISLFENSRGKIPLFIELRKMAQLHTKDIVAFMYHSIIEPGAVLTEKQFGLHPVWMTRS